MEIKLIPADAMRVPHNKTGAVNCFCHRPRQVACAGIVRRSLSWRADLVLALRAAAAPSVSQSVAAAPESGQASTPSAEPSARCGCEPTASVAAQAA